MALTVDHIDTFLAAKDVLQMLLAGHRDGAAVDQAAVDELLTRLHALADQHGGTPTPAPVIAAPVTPAAAKPAPETRRVRITMPGISTADFSALSDELALLGRVIPLQGDVPAVLLETAETCDDIAAVCTFIVDPALLRIEEIETAPYELFDPLPDVAATASAAATAGTAMPAAPARQAAPAAQSGGGVESSSIRVPVEKVDQLINLVGELVITQAMIEQRTHGLDPMQHEKLLNGVSQLTRNTRHLQEAVMSIRMMPMDYVFSRFPRMVRDLAGKLGKKVEFLTQGAATELDKGLIERIIDPLTHLVRNSIDHGIEMPEARIAAGKDATGRLTLSAEHRGGHVVIEVSDDGGGLSRDRILAKARQQGLPITEGMPDHEVWQLIFAPGFSTAEVVTDVSGRGVGMDVVRRNISALGGQVEIRSTAGRGSTVSIALPLTLAILDGMSVRSGNEIYILPLNYVLESLQPQPQDVSRIAGQGQVVRVRGEYLPLVSLRQVFNTNGIADDAGTGIAIILEAEGQRAALLIDELVGQQQVVVKNLEANYRRVAGVSGATILGDGSVALILDVSALLRGARATVSH